MPTKFFGMKRNDGIARLLLLAAILAGFACGAIRRRSTRLRERCSCPPEFKPLEDEIERVCAEVTATMLQEGQTDAVGAFCAAQTVWRAYRDAEVNALYPPWEETSGAAELRRNDLRAELAAERLRQLRGWWE